MLLVDMPRGEMAPCPPSTKRIPSVGFPKIGVPLLRVRERGFYSIWGYKRGAPHFGKYPAVLDSVLCLGSGFPQKASSCSTVGSSVVHGALCSASSKWL